MNRRKSTPTLGQMALAQQVQSPKAKVQSQGQNVPALVEYQFGREAWRCEHFDQLVGEFETVTPETLERFHQAASLNGRRWLFIRRLFGLQPVVPGPDTDPDDLRVWSRDELGAHFQLTRPQLKAELDVVRGTWDGFWKAEASPETPKPEAGSQKPITELDLEEDPILKKYNFRVYFSDSTERDWFLAKVRDFEVVLNEKIVSGMAHTACLTALRLQRANQRLDEFAPELVGGKDWKAVHDLVRGLGADYNAGVEKILDLCPSASQLAGKLAFQPVISTITRALQEFHGQNDGRLVDGIFTAAEIQVECRRSTQTPEPRYRAGWVVLMNSAQAGLFDPKWKPPFDDRLAQKMDLAWKAAFIAASGAEAVPDLAADGPASEYEDLKQPEN